MAAPRRASPSLVLLALTLAAALLGTSHAGRALLQCTAESTAVAGAEESASATISDAVAKAISECKQLPADQSCDAIAQAQAKVRLRSTWSWQACVGHCPHLPEGGTRCSRAPPPPSHLPLQSIATAVARAVAQTAGSVKGGPGCKGQARAIECCLNRDQTRVPEFAHVLHTTRSSSPYRRRLRPLQRPPPQEGRTPPLCRALAARTRPLPPPALRPRRRHSPRCVQRGGGGRGLPGTAAACRG